MHVLLIGNPIAGGGRAGKLVHELAEALKDKGAEPEVYLTSRGGDARRRAAELGDGVDRVAVVGGDGTLNEVINGLEDPSRVPIAQLPLGTANIVARELSFPFKPRGAAEMIVNGDIRRLDLGVATLPATDSREASAKRFIAVVSAGFDAMVTRDIAETRKGSLGFRGYVKPTIRTVLKYQMPQLRVRVDGGEPIEGAMVVVSNIRNYAGFFAITDQAQPDSGQLDVCVLPLGSRTALLMYAAAALGRVLSKATNAVCAAGRRISIDAVDPGVPTPVELDGDYIGETPVELTVQPQILPVVVPQPRG